MPPSRSYSILPCYASSFNPFQYLSKFGIYLFCGLPHFLLLSIFPHNRFFGKLSLLILSTCPSQLRGQDFLNIFASSIVSISWLLLILHLSPSPIDPYILCTTLCKSYSWYNDNIVHVSNLYVNTGVLSVFSFRALERKFAFNSSILTKFDLFSVIILLLISMETMYSLFKIIPR